MIPYLYYLVTRVTTSEFIGPCFAIVGSLRIDHLNVVENSRKTFNSAKLYFE